jgi:hypothetical protein
LTLRWLFPDVANGFYIDVGAYHPKRLSNTYYFYKRGWTGINIDPTPGIIELFKKARPRDINLPYAVASGGKELKFYVNENERGVNTLSPDWDRRPIDFLSVDVEGMDLEVLKSNDWDEFVPKVILCEDIFLPDIEDASRCATWEFLNTRGYRLVGKCVHTLIFAHGSYKEFV